MKKLTLLIPLLLLVRTIFGQPCSPGDPNYPDAPTITNAASTYCLNDEIELTGTLSSGTLTWFDSDPSLGSPSPIGTGSPLPISPPEGTITYYAQAVVTPGQCVSEVSEITLTIHPIPDSLVIRLGTLGEVSETDTVCTWQYYQVSPDNPVTGIVAINNYIWTTTDPAVPSSGFTILGGTQTEVGTVEYWLNYTNQFGCNGPEAYREVVVIQSPPPPTVDDQIICAGDEIPTLFATDAEGPLNWYLNNPYGGGLGGPIPTPDHTGPTFTPNIASVPLTKTFWVTQIAENGCHTPRILATEVTVTILAAPTVSIFNPDPICEGAPMPELNVLDNTGTFSWYDSDPIDGSITPIATGSSFTPSVPSVVGDYTFWVTKTIGCEGNGFPVTVTVSPFPSPPMANNLAICAGDPIPQLQALGGLNNYKWYDEDPSLGLATPVATSSSFTPTISSVAGTYPFWVTQTVANCEGPAQITTITINEIPVAPVVSNPNAICDGETIPTLVIFSSANSIRWYNSDPAVGSPIPVGTGPSFQPILPSGPGIYSFWATQTILDCESAAAVSTISINESPFFTNEAGLCASDFQTYSVDISTNGNEVIPNIGTVSDNGNGNFTITNIPSGTDLLFDINDTVSGCSSTGNVIESPECTCPTVPLPIGDNAVICEHEPIPNLMVTATMGLQVNWYDAANEGNLLLSNSLSYTPTTSGTYYAETINPINNCISNGRTPINLVIHPLPDFLQNEIACSDDLNNYTVDFNTNGNSVTASNGTVNDLGSGQFRISAIPAEQNITIQIENNDTGCAQYFEVEAPDCSCPTINPP
ncbi:MAG: hypothetical protein AAF985_19090, partial [Bacteroidota bacterium]